MARTFIRLRILFALLAVAACASARPPTVTTNAPPAALNWSSPQHHVVLIWEDELLFKPERGSRGEDWDQRFSDAVAAKGVSLLSIHLAHEASSELRLCVYDLNCEDIVRESNNADFVLHIITRGGSYRRRSVGEFLSTALLEFPLIGPCVILGPLPTPCDRLPDPTADVRNPNSVFAQLHDVRTKAVVWENAISQEDWRIKDGVQKLLKGSPF